MFGMSLIEILVILTLALVILGPEKLPPLARQLGKLMRQLRRASDEIRNVIEFESLRDDMRRPLDELRGLKKDLDPYKAIRAEEQAWRQSVTLTPAADVKSSSAPAPSAPPASPWYDEAPEARPEVQRLALPDALPEEDSPRALDEHLRLVPLPRRLGWGSLDARIEAMALPAVPARLLFEVREVALRGGALELRAADAQAAAPSPDLGAAVSAVALRPRLRGSWRRPSWRAAPVRAASPAPLRAIPLPAAIIPPPEEAP
jgi:Tat protein translocase TatB subunit